MPRNWSFGEFGTTAPPVDDDVDPDPEPEPEPDPDPVFADDFDRPDDDTLGNGWDSGADPSPVLADGKASTFSGPYVISAHALPGDFDPEGDWTVTWDFESATGLTGGAMVAMVDGVDFSGLSVLTRGDLVLQRRTPGFGASAIDSEPLPAVPLLAGSIRWTHAAGGDLRVYLDGELLISVDGYAVDVPGALVVIFMEDPANSDEATIDNLAVYDQVIEP